MKKVMMMAAVGLMALTAGAADIGGKFAFGFEQGVGVGNGSAENLGRGCSFKLCLTNNVAVKGALGFNYSSKLDEITDPTQTNPVVYKEDKPRVDVSGALYGIIVFRRFEKVHLNGMAGVVVSTTDNHFNPSTEKDLDTNSFDIAQRDLNEPSKSLKVHLRVLMAPEIFIFPNFSLEYKYGFDVSMKKENPVINGTSYESQSRWYVDVIGDLNLLQSASVHFYF